MIGLLVMDVLGDLQTSSNILKGCFFALCVVFSVFASKMSKSIYKYCGRIDRLEISVDTEEEFNLELGPTISVLSEE